MVEIERIEGNGYPRAYELPEKVRKAFIKEIDLKYGSGGYDDEIFQKAMCIMEATAFIAGEPHSDHPECASKYLTTFMIDLNDNMDEEIRQKLKKYIPLLVGSRTTDKHDSRRAAFVQKVLKEHALKNGKLATLMNHIKKVSADPNLVNIENLTDFLDGFDICCNSVDQLGTGYLVGEDWSFIKKVLDGLFKVK